jgi:glucose-6-phosphate-specific signal transduction histidine kinase
LFNDTFFSAEIIKEEDIINTLKEVNKDLSKRIRKIKSLLGEIKELIDADESITTSFVSELWDEITD